LSRSRFRKPHLPIWIGGDAEPMLKRAARYASGWFPWLTCPADIPAKIDFIKSQPTYDGRPFEVLYGLGTSQIGEGHKSLTTPPNNPG
jgi:alkanesulfonate monooxygenase SsuD/methylene tetrahydromethanopterin reductase-like flavin-dependent oxidoreductase (luciferase family)